MDHPHWWDWELAYTEHTESRMEERGISELELRTMLEDASSMSPAVRSGRWLVETRYAGRRWNVVLEPDVDERLLFVVTVYPKA
jgi:hypothetical protein